MAQESLNPFEIAQRQFDTAADKMGLGDGMREVLRNPKRQLLVSVPTVMDDGTVRVFNGYRVQHNIARGPAKGGIRYHPRHPRRDEGAGVLDDVEVRHRQRALRRQQGRRRLRPQDACRAASWSA